MFDPKDSICRFEMLIHSEKIAGLETAPLMNEIVHFLLYPLPIDPKLLELLKVAPQLRKVPNAYHKATVEFQITRVHPLVASFDPFPHRYQQVA